MPLWGLGKVIEIAPPYFVAHFRSLNGRRQVLGESCNWPRRRFRSQPCNPMKPWQGPIAVKGKKAKPNGGKLNVPKPTLHSVDQTIAWFEKTYPKRFEDPKLIEMELGYKRKAHKTFVRHSDAAVDRALLDAGDLPSISKALDELYHATNIPARFEIDGRSRWPERRQSCCTLLRGALDFIGARPDAHSFVTAG